MRSVTDRQSMETYAWCHRIKQLRESYSHHIKRRTASRLSTARFTSQFFRSSREAGPPLDAL